MTTKAAERRLRRRAKKNIALMRAAVGSPEFRELQRLMDQFDRLYWRVRAFEDRHSHGCKCALCKYTTAADKSNGLWQQLEAFMLLLRTAADLTDGEMPWLFD